MLALVLALPSSAGGVPAYGVDDFRPAGEIPFSELTHIARANLRLYRQNLYLEWAPLRSPAAAGHRDWSIVDGMVQKAALADVTWLPELISDQNGIGPAASAPRDPASQAGFAGFAAAVAVRYGPLGPHGRGSFWRERGCLPGWCPHGLPYRPLEVIEVWNEPNLPSFWPFDPDDARSVRNAIVEYRELLRRVRNEVRASGADVRILAGSLAPASIRGYAPERYVTRLMAHDGGACLFDAAGFHPYTPAKWDQASAEVGAAFAAGVDRFQAAVHAHAPDAPIYLTEWGWAVSPPAERPNDPAAYEGLVASGDAKQAAYLDQSLAEIERHRSTWNLGASVYFTGRDNRPGSSERWAFNWMGLYRWEPGDPAGVLDTPRPAFAELREIASVAPELPPPPRRCP